MMKRRTYVTVATVAGVALGAAYLLGIDVTDAATAVAGGTDKLGAGVQDAGKTIESGLIGYVGPVATIGGGLAGAFGARGMGASAGQSIVGGIFSAVGISFIPIAGTSTYTTSGSNAAASLYGLVPPVSPLTDGFVLLSAAALFIAYTLFREMRRAS
jgi:hypothetical protein